MSNKTDLIDHNFLENIDTENKSYLLGWIAACQSIVENKIAIETNKTNLEFFKIVRDIVSHDIPIINDGNLISLSSPCLFIISFIFLKNISPFL